MTLRRGPRPRGRGRDDTSPDVVGVDRLQLTPFLSRDTGLTFERERALPGGSVEIVYACHA